MVSPTRIVSANHPALRGFMMNLCAMAAIKTMGVPGMSGKKLPMQPMAITTRATISAMMSFSSMASLLLHWFHDLEIGIQFGRKQSFVEFWIEHGIVELITHGGAV